MTETPYLLERKPFSRPQEADLVQIVRDIINAELQKHVDYFDCQFLVLSSNVKTLSASMDQKIKEIKEQLGDLSEQGLQQMVQDIKIDVDRLQCSSSTLVAGFNGMAEESDETEKDMKALIAQCEKFLKVPVPDVMDKLEASHVQNGHSTRPLSQRLHAEGIMTVKNTGAELSRQAGSKEWHARATHVQGLPLDNQSLLAHCGDSVAATGDTLANDCTSHINNSPSEDAALLVHSCDFAQATVTRWLTPVIRWSTVGQSP